MRAVVPLQDKGRMPLQENFQFDIGKRMNRNSRLPSRGSNLGVMYIHLLYLYYHQDRREMTEICNEFSLSYTFV